MPEMFSIQMDDMRELARRLDNINVMAACKVAMQKSLYLLQNQAAIYPPARPGSRYRRTGTLGRKWTTKMEEGPASLVGILSSDAQSETGEKYGRFVKGPYEQWAIFEDIGWKRLDQDLEAKLPEIEKLFFDVLKEVMAGIIG